MSLHVDLAPHGFDAPGDGYPACTVSGCGRPRPDAIHVTGKIRTRLLLVIDHAAVLPATVIEAAILERIADLTGLVIANSAVIP